MKRVFIPSDILILSFANPVINESFAPLNKNQKHAHTALPEEKEYDSELPSWHTCVFFFFVLQLFLFLEKLSELPIF